MNFDKTLKKANEIYEQGKFEEAKEIYQSIMLSSGDINATLMYGNCLSQIGKHEAAIKIYKKLTELDPYDEAPWYNLGCEYLELNRPMKALKYFQKAKEIDTDNADAYYKVGYCYQCLDDVEQAIAQYKHSLEIEASEKAFFRLGIAYMIYEMDDKALDCLLKANEIESDHYDTNFYIGLCYDKLKNPHKAIKYYNKALKFENNFNAHINVSLCYYDVRDIDSALKHSKTAYNLNPNEPDTLRYYCYILMKAKNDKEAYNLLCSTEIDFDDDYSLLEMLIFLSLYCGDFERADKAFLNLKNIDPKGETVLDYEKIKKEAQEKNQRKQ